MKNIKLFENFDSKYLWPEAKFWIDKLEPEELCFLGVYSYMLEKESDRNQPLFEVEYDGTNEAEPDEDGDGSLEMIFSFPVEKSESSVYISCVILFSGGFSKYYKDLLTLNAIPNQLIKNSKLSLLMLDSRRSWATSDNYMLNLFQKMGHKLLCCHC